LFGEKLDRFQAVLDVLGVVDPTPISDGLNALIYASRGQWGNAGVSVLGIVPYVGDAAKTAKYGVRAAKTGGRLGTDLTRAHVANVAAELESRGWTITGGGGRLPEEYLAGPGGKRIGSSFPDITATRNGRTLRINTVDTYADGFTPTAREAANAARIRSQTPGDHLLLVPKPNP
jgi:hypothetical protein